MPNETLNVIGMGYRNLDYDIVYAQEEKAKDLCPNCLCEFDKFMKPKLIKEGEL